MIRLRLKPGREESVLRRHPWLFSGAVASTEGDGSDGQAEVVSSRGEPLGRGAYSPESQIVARLWTFDSRPLDAELFSERFLAARRLRERVVPSETTGYRLLNSEGDGCPGVVLDRYGDVALLELLTGGTQAWSSELQAAARYVFTPLRLVVRESGTARDRGRASLSGASAGAGKSGDHQRRPDSSSGLPDDERRDEDSLVPFLEEGLNFFADLTGGQKTGFFLDQRENRARLRADARGRSVLNLFSYSGAFSVAALAGGATRAVDVDSSEAALALASRHREANGLPAEDRDFVRADVFEDVRRRVESRESWDIVVCDPPAFAKKRSDLERAARGYKDVNRLAMALVAPGGFLLTFSCSGLVDLDLFQKIIFSANLESGSSFSFLARCGAGPDHPVSLDCPEGEYLKGLWLTKREA
ncbi:MAG TPA: class I SAM-dependent rRNA methyltransferase [Thermoanaerobaculia bacterium]|nr:class I SAM-dependent rRNA methyltransferase [Thermoanaerobaculia bacterium]